MKAKITLLLQTLLIFTFNSLDIQAQSNDCDITGSTSGNYTFQSNKKVCFYSNATLGDVTFQNGAKIYIAPNVTVIIQNNINSSGAIEMKIEGTLQFSQAVTINANVNLTIGTNGVLKAGSSGTTDFRLNGAGINTILNNGQFNVGVLELQNSNGTYTFDNSPNATININSNININGKSYFRNQGKLLIRNSYNCNNRSVFVNCGEMVSSAGFNLGGGKVINTGKFTVTSSRVDFGSSTARFENYGSVNVQGSMNLGGTGCVYYNEGTTVVSESFQNDGNIEGPEVGSAKLGYITWRGRATMNNGKIGPNLNLINSGGSSNLSGMFNNPSAMNFQQGVMYNCTNCPAPQINSGAVCRELDGNTPDIDETCNVYTTVLAEPTEALVRSLNDTGKGLFPVKPSGPAYLPNGGVKVEVIKNFTRRPEQWRLYQPTALTGTINIKGVPTTFKTKYLDLIGAYTNPLVLERTVKLDYEVTSKSLNTTTHAYRYIIGIAGLSDSNVAGKVISSVPLEVIGNMDAYQTGKYSFFNDTTPPVAGQKGTVFESNPKTPSSAPSNTLTNGYTFFYLPDDITSFELETKGNDQYGFIFGTLTTTISPTPNAPTSGGNQTVCWNGNTNHTLTATATAPQGQIVTWYETATGGNPVASPTQVGVGTKTYYAQSSNPNGTCTSLTRTAVTLTINTTPVAPISGGNQTVCSDRTTTQTLTATATVPQGSSVNWYTTETGGSPVTSPTQIGVGTKTYYAQASNGICSSLTRTAVTLTINPAAGIPTTENVEYCAGDTAQALKATASNPDYTLYFYDSLDSTPQASIIPITTTAGEFTYYVAEGINNSCIGDKKAITVIVHPKSVITTEPINQNITYGDNTNFSVTATDVTSYQWQVNKGSGFENITNNTIYSNATTATLNITKPTVAMSSYTYRAILKGRCTETETQTVNVTVSPKAVTVTADNKTKVYGEQNPALTAVVTGAVNGDAINYTLATPATQFSNVGTYPIEVTLGENPNYTVTKVDGTLTITPKAIDVVVTADNKTKVYGEQNPTLTAVVTGAVNGDAINYTLATPATQFSNVGTYPIEVTLGENPNYTVNKVDGMLTITPKAIDVVVTADNKTKVYGEQNPALTAVITGAVNGDVINYTLATTATQFSNVGTYPIEVTLGENPNYTVNKVDGTLTITKKSSTVTPNDVSKECSDSDPVFTGLVEGFLSRDEVVATYLRSSEMSNAIVATLAPVNVLDNYNVTYNTGAYNVIDHTAPIPTTEYQSVINTTCANIPEVPALEFVDRCSEGSPTVIYTEDIVNSTSSSYSIVRKWKVNDINNNTAEYIQTVNVSIVPDVVTITVPDFVNSVNGTPVDLSTYLPQDAPTNGTWIDVNNSGLLSGSYIDPNRATTADYTFNYVVETTSCPIVYVVNLKIDESFVLGCGTIHVHNAFTPNGDDKNKVFKIDNIEDTLCYPENSVEIYNRWGVLVYEVKDYNNQDKAFKGFSEGRVTVDKGAGLPTGTYFYILKYTAVGLQGELIPKAEQGYLYLTR